MKAAESKASRFTAPGLAMLYKPAVCAVFPVISYFDLTLEFPGRLRVQA